jgi:succinate dehydrogenase / fumarate reductase cytochrome b subunit
MESAQASTHAPAHPIIRFLESSIGKKVTVALAGLFLSVFLITHLLGNLFLFGGEKAFNAYAGMLESNPLIPIAEVGLLVLFLVHIVLALRARFINSAARPVGYQVSGTKGHRTLGSRTIAISGVVILLFLCVHLNSMRFIPHEVREFRLYPVVREVFHNPVMAGFYVLALLALGLHLSHGIQSAFQTLGVNHARYTPLIKKLGLGLAALIMLGFMSMPIYFGFLGGNP